MMKRLSLLLAALFVASMVLVTPVFASGNHENNDGADSEKVCVLHNNKGDEHNNGEHKDYRWVSEENKHHGDKVVKDKFCEDNNGEHKNNNDDNGHANNNDDDNGNANDDDWS
jgi:hypothetical protein